MLQIIKDASWEMIEMFESLVFVMSLSGCLISIFWHIIHRLYFLQFKAKWLRNMILMAIPFFLLPVPLLRNRRCSGQNLYCIEPGKCCLSFILGTIIAACYGLGAHYFMRFHHTPSAYIP